MIFSTQPDIKGRRCPGDREYFSVLAAGQAWYFSSLLVSRQTGQQIFVVSKRLTRNGELGRGRHNLLRRRPPARDLGIASTWTRNRPSAGAQ